MLSGQPGGPRMYPRSGYFLVRYKDISHCIIYTANINLWDIIELQSVMRYKDISHCIIYTANIYINQYKCNTHDMIFIASL